jgi:hypothetical protein
LVKIDDEPDPHGLFEYMETRPYYEEEDWGPDAFMELKKEEEDAEE